MSFTEFPSVIIFAVVITRSDRPKSPMISDTRHELFLELMKWNTWL